MNSPRIPGLACIVVCALLTGCFGGSAAQKARPEVQVRAEVLLTRAIRAEQKGEAREAERLLEESLRLSTSIEDNSATVRAQINLARLYRLRHDTARSRTAIDAALALLGTEADSHSEAAQEKALIELPSDSALALTWAHKAVSAEKGDWAGRRLNLLGRIQLVRGDLAAAGVTLKKALDENRDSGHGEEEANSLRMLGLIARNHQRFADSEHMLTAALEIDKRIGVSVKIAMDLEELGLTARQAGNLERAAGYLERACNVHLNGGRMAQTVADLTTLAEIYDQWDNSNKAETTRKKARQLPHQPGTPPETTKPPTGP